VGRTSKGKTSSLSLCLGTISLRLRCRRRSSQEDVPTQSDAPVSKVIASPDRRRDALPVARLNRLARPPDWPQSKTRRPDQTALRSAALQGDRGAFELHWAAGGRPLAVRWAVGVCLGRNDVARASRCGWLHGLGSRRSKPLMPERNEPVIVTVRVFNDLSESWCRKSKQNGGQSNLRLSHGFHSLV
jgi:hypothetical protein